MTEIIWSNYSLYKDIDIKDYVGFVYKICSKETGKVYYGIKKFKKKIRRKPLKGKKRVRIDYIESDWKTYKTSSPLLQKELEDGLNNYDCQIINICTSITDMKAREAYYQLEHYIKGDWDSLINEMINLRIRIR